MDDTACQRFFEEPTQTFHRQYEALRAFFIDHRSLGDIAQRFGYSYDTVRSLVRDFRARSQTGRSSPFSPPLDGGDGLGTPPLPSHPSGKRPPSPMSASWI
jgi:hypothetical protein